MAAYLIDTNHASAFMSNVQPVTERISQLARDGEQFYLCMTVVGELYFAVYASTRRRRNLMNLERLLERIAVLDFDMAAAEEYGHIKAELKAKGRPIPGTDAQIAAAARLHGLTVLSADRHFQYVDNLRAENWL
jgi:tRNA(fMet)-specific endonuclease VapC